MQRIKSFSFGAVLASVLLIVAISPLSAEETAKEDAPLIGIIPVVSPDRGDYLDSLNSTLTDTLEITVRFLGDYRVKKIGDFRSEPNEENLQEFAGENGYDTIVFGDTALSDNGEVRIHLSAYNARKGRISAEEIGHAKSMLQTFATTDSLVASLVEGFTDSRVEYGRIRFVYTGVPAQVDIYIDETHVGMNVQQIPKMVAGTHHIRVQRSVENGVENGPVYLDKTMDIAAHTTNEIPVPVPLLSEEETARLRSIDMQVGRAWNSSAGSDYISRFLAEAISLLETSRSVGAERVLPLYRQRFNAAVNRTTERKEKVQYDSFASLFDRAKTGGEIPKTSIYTVWHMHGTRNLLPMRSIKVDGRVNDWEGIEPLTSPDYEGDSSSSKVGTDLKNLYLAMDKKYTYVRIDTYRGVPASTTHFWYTLSLFKPFKSNIRYALEITKHEESYSAEVNKYDLNAGQLFSRHRAGNSLWMSGTHIEARFLNSTILDFLDQNNKDSFRYEYIDIEYFLVGHDSEARDRIRISHVPAGIIYRNWD